MADDEEAGKASLAPQRAFNLLCIAYGSDQAAFQDLVKVAELPGPEPQAVPTSIARWQARLGELIDKGYVDMDRMQKLTSSIEATFTIAMQLKSFVMTFLARIELPIKP